MDCVSRNRMAKVTIARLVEFPRKQRRAGWKRVSRWFRDALLFAAVMMLWPGCNAPSLLITPVSSRRTLDETELSRDSFFARDKIVLVEVSGAIMNAPRAQLFGEGEHPVSLLLEQLDRARRDRAVKAVVLRINSPGGSVVASELMHEEIMRFRSTGRPVIAVLMDVAASGGYYIACACDEIIAQPSTVTGSIGIIMQMVDVTGTMKLIGVNTDAITSGRYKDAGSPLRPMKPDEREIFQDIVDDMFGRFVDVVAEGRPKLDQGRVRAIADGRVYTATQALELGLIDRIGTIRDAVEVAKERAGVDRTKLVTYHRPLDYKPNYYARVPRVTNSGEININLLRLDASSLYDITTPRFLYLWQPGVSR
jgi:protease IV